jgi:CubicO group peptidase (beta-lactamase class C family)
VWITRFNARRGSWLSTFFAVILGAVLSGCATTPSLDDELAKIASDPQHRLASLSVLAVRDGRVVYERQFGDRFIATATDAAKPANAQTMYRIASISKLVVAVGVMRLVEEGKLALDEDVGTYLGWRLRNPHFPDAKITLRMFLTHTSSLRDGAFYFWPATIAIKV